MKRILVLDNELSKGLIFSTLHGRYVYLGTNIGYFVHLAAFKYHQIQREYNPHSNSLVFTNANSHHKLNPFLNYKQGEMD